MNLELIQAGRNYVQAGLTIIPINAKKKPAIEEWTSFENGRRTRLEDIEEWSKSHYVHGWAVVCGPPSDNVCILDFDVPGFYENWAALVGDLAKELPTQQTGSGDGRQVAFKTSLNLRNDKLAYSPADNKEGREIAIETRCAGGYAVLPPSFCPQAKKRGIPHKQAYKTIQGDFTKIPTIPPEEAQRLLEAARSLCQAPLSLSQMKVAPIPPRSNGATAGGGVIAAFNAFYQVGAILEKNGYQPRGNRYLAPDSTTGEPGVYIFEDTGRCFSHHSNDPLNDGHSHDPFSVFCILEHGGDVKAAVKAAAEALGIERPQAQAQAAGETTAVTTTVTYSFSDLGNARRLVALHGQDLHYCHLSKKWWVWTGKVWAVDNSGEVRRRAKATIAEIYREAAEAGEKAREALVKFALQSERDSRIKGMLSLAESEPGIPISPGLMDADPWRLNVLNGTIDLKTGKLRPHNRADLITRLAPIEFDPRATCPRWERFLDHIQKTNHDVISFIQRILGYALTGDCREQCLFLLWGSGANGKSTLLAIISAILGNYAMQTPTETLLAKQKGEIPNDIARLNGPRFVTALEVSQWRRLAEPLVKQLTGQDTIAARFLFGEYFDFKPQFKLFLGTNHKPVIKDTTHAMWRRIRLIPFPVQIPEAEQDKGLAAALLGEAPGILAWAIRGCLSWQHGGLSVPYEVTTATGDYQAEQDVLGDFLAECCIMAPGASATAAELYKNYKTWADENGEKKPFSQKVFGLTLAERGFARTRGHGGKTVWQGIGVKD